MQSLITADTCPHSLTALRYTSYALNDLAASSLALHGLSKTFCCAYDYYRCALLQFKYFELPYIFFRQLGAQWPKSAFVAVLKWPFLGRYLRAR
eukprot:5337192-Amphidinium_carterae.2